MTIDDYTKENMKYFPLTILLLDKFSYFVTLESNLQVKYIKIGGASTRLSSIIVNLSCLFTFLITSFDNFLIYLLYQKIIKKMIFSLKFNKSFSN